MLICIFPISQQHYCTTSGGSAVMSLAKCCFGSFSGQNSPHPRQLTLLHLHNINTCSSSQGQQCKTGRRGIRLAIHGSKTVVNPVTRHKLRQMSRKKATKTPVGIIFPVKLFLCLIICLFLVSICFMNQMIRQAAGRRTAGWTAPIVVSQSKPSGAALILHALLTFHAAEQAKRK